VSTAPGHPVLRFLVRRVAAGMATLVVVSMLIFGALQVLPGDVASVALGKNATPERVAAMRGELGLERPLPERYVDWATSTVQGDFGLSTAALAQGTREPVSSAIGTPIRNSLALAGLTLLLMIPLSLVLGTVAALRSGRAVDRAVSIGALALAALPEFLVGTVLVFVFFTQLDVLPALAQIPPGDTPLAHLDALIMPVLTLLAATVAVGARMVRATTIEVLGENYVAMARLHGLPRRRVIVRYALRNALAPNVQLLALLTQYLITGVIVVESVFAYPGIGQLLVQSVATRDVQMVAIIATLVAAVYILINIVADLAVTLLVPKLRTAEL
jgi:peptide/nickel transport system permease protein